MSFPIGVSLAAEVPWIPAAGSPSPGCDDISLISDNGIRIYRTKFVANPG